MAQTTTSEEALRFLKRLLLDADTPVQLKSGIVSRLGTSSARETTLRTAISIARNPSNTNAERLAALSTVIQFAKGDA